MSISLALADAATNCMRDHALAILTLRSGTQITGSIVKERLVGADTCQIRFDDGGWGTVLIKEIVAVESRPKRR